MWPVRRGPHLNLTPQQTAVLELRYVEGVPTDTLVAERLGLQRPTVTEHRRKALAQLRTVEITAENLGQLLETLRETPKSL